VASPFDIAIIGGGINGVGIARDAAGRGLKVLLCERGDLAGATSSASTKLIHGGLRYLEYYEFGLVRHALAEREVLLAAAPHIIRPLRFVLPHHRGLRPAWLIRLGLFLYDHIGGRRLLPPTRSLDLSRDEAGRPLKPGYRRAFEYSDCRVDDSRLVVLNAIDAAARGADIRTRTELLGARRRGGLWSLDLGGGPAASAEARILVNAAGPWVGQVLERRLGLAGRAPVRLVKGSHIIVPRLFAHDRAYIFQNADGRIVFAIPYEGDFTLIGTTDVDYRGDPAAVAITPEETGYLAAAASEYFAEPVRPDRVVHAYSGVRPLYDDHASEAKAATRDYVLALDAPEGGAPLLNVFGGKLTTYRRLAEDALRKLGVAGRPWTAGALLPGGDLPAGGVAALAAELAGIAAPLGPAHLPRLARLYGSRARGIAEAARASGWGAVFGDDLSEVELRYLRAEEWAVTAEDVLWRRTRLGLRLPAAEAARLEAWLAAAALPLASDAPALVP
jgi:glycerol-3-phosphate dehydrogenase